MHMPSWLWVAGLPLLTAVGLLAREAEPGTWLALTQPTRWRVATDALLVNASAVVICAPVIGVMAIARLHATTDGPLRASGWAIARYIGAWVVPFVAVSAVVTLYGYGAAPPALGLVAGSHTTLAAAAIALAALGAWCANRLRHPLDAVACSVALALLVAFGILLGGPLVQDLPYPVVNAALLASPLVATAASAQIDILRTETLYQLSPLAHRRFEYPVWQAATAVYLVFAVLCCGDMFRRSRRR